MPTGIRPGQRSARVAFPYEGTKLLLRRALRGLVPDALLDRKKHGFEVPVRKWMLGDLVDLAERLLLRPDAPIGACVDLPTVRRLWTRLTATHDLQLARQVWVLLNLAVWHDIHWGWGRRCGDMASAEEVSG